MPFGKHKGKEVKDLSPKYLEWLVANTNLYGDLQTEVYKRLGIEPPKKMSVYDRLYEVVSEMHLRLLEEDEG